MRRQGDISVEIKNDDDVAKAESMMIDFKKKIAKLQADKKTFEESKTSRSFGIRMSITGILSRVYTKKNGFTLAQIRREYDTCLMDFCKHFEMAKESYKEGDMETVDQFFNIYC